MWIFSRHGFYCIVRDVRDVRDVHDTQGARERQRRWGRWDSGRDGGGRGAERFWVQARERQDLVNLRWRACLSPPIQEAPGGEYPFFLRVEAAELARLLVYLSRTLDYARFPEDAGVCSGGPGRLPLYRSIQALLEETGETGAPSDPGA